MKNAIKLSSLTAIAFFSIMTLKAQVKIGANPTVITSTSALEVEATGGSKVTVDKTTGKITIKDGSQGVGKVLTSDANGIATWQAQTLPVVSVLTDHLTGKF